VSGRVCRVVSRRAGRRAQDRRRREWAAWVPARLPPRPRPPSKLTKARRDSKLSTWTRSASFRGTALTQGSISKSKKRQTRGIPSVILLAKRHQACRQRIEAVVKPACRRQAWCRFFLSGSKGKRDLSVTESSQLYHVTTPSLRSQSISESKSWIPTNQIYGIQKDR